MASSLIAMLLIIIATMLAAPNNAEAAPIVGDTAYDRTTWHDAGSKYLSVIFIDASTNSAIERGHTAKLVGQTSNTVINLTIDDDGYCAIPLTDVASTGELYELYIDDVKNPREYVFGVEPSSPNMYFIGMKGTDEQIVDACFYNVADFEGDSIYMPILFADMIDGQMQTEQIGIPLKIYINDEMMYGGQGMFYDGEYKPGLDEYAQIYLDRFYLYQSDGNMIRPLSDTNIELRDAVTGSIMYQPGNRSINTSFVHYDEDNNKYYIYFPNVPVYDEYASASWTIKQLPIGTKNELHENRDESYVAVTDGLRAFEPMSMKLSALSDPRYVPNRHAAVVFATQSDCPDPSDLRLSNPQRNFPVAYLGYVNVDGDISDRGTTPASGSVRSPITFEEYLSVQTVRSRTIPTGYTARLVNGDNAYEGDVNTTIDTGIIGFWGLGVSSHGSPITLVDQAFLPNAEGIFDDIFLVPGNDYEYVRASTAFLQTNNGYLPTGTNYNFNLIWNSFKMDWDWVLQNDGYGYHSAGNIQNKKMSFPEETLVSMGYDNYLPQADDLNIETIFLNGEPNRSIFFKVTDYEVDPENPDFRNDALYPGKDGLRFRLFNYPDIANYPEKLTEMDYADEYELDYAYSNDKLYDFQRDAGCVTFKNAISTEQLLNSDNKLKISMRNSPNGYDIDEDGTGSKLLEYASFDLSLKGFNLQNDYFDGNIESSNPHNLSYSEYSDSTLPMYFIMGISPVMGISLDQDYDYTYPYSELVIHVNFDESDGTEYTEDELKALFKIAYNDGSTIVRGLPDEQITIVESNNPDYDYEYHILVPYEGTALPADGTVQANATKYTIKPSPIGSHNSVATINMNLNAYGQFYYYSGYDLSSTSTYADPIQTSAVYGTDRILLEQDNDSPKLLNDELDTNDIYITLPKNTAPNFDTASSVTTIVKTDFETGEAVTDNPTGFKLYHYYTDGTYTQKEYAVFDRNNSYVADGEPATVLYTDETGHLEVYNLPAGTWYIEETDVPDGYVRNERDKSFAISSTFALDSLGFACFNGRRIYWEPTSRTFTITPTAFPIMLYNTSGERVETYTYEAKYRLGFYDKNSGQKTYLTLLANGDIVTAAASEANTVPLLKIIHFDSYGDTIKISPTPGQDYTLGLSTDGAFLTTIPVDDIEQLKTQTVVFYNSKILPDPERGMFELPILTVPVSATKVLYGEDLVGNDFEFELYQRTVDGISGDETDELIATASNNAQGAIEFSLVFDEADVDETFTYVLKEKLGSRTDMDYDDTEHIFTISLMNGANGIEITNGSDAGIVFYNTVNPTAIITGVDNHLGAKTVVLIVIPIALALPYVALRRRSQRREEQ